MASSLNAAIVLGGVGVLGNDRRLSRTRRPTLLAQEVLRGALLLQNKRLACYAKCMQGCMNAGST